MDISEKPDVSVMEMVDKLQGSKPLPTDRMAPQVLTKEIEEEPQPIVMDRMAPSEVSTMDKMAPTEDPHILTKDLIEELHETVTDRMAPSEVLTKDIIEDPQEPVMDRMAPTEVLTKDLVEEPQAPVMDGMVPHEVLTKDLIIEDPPASTFNTLETAPATVVNTLEKPLIATMDKMARPQVTVRQGRIEGLYLKTDSGFPYKAFLGVPYAKPPIGNLRFKDPQPSDHWDGVRDATVEGNICPQIDIVKKVFHGKEDCLYLNVYAPEGATTDSDLPVMFWIHGGGFKFGSGGRDMYGPDFLVDKYVVLVTINYRMGPLGFLCLNTAECPGNAGLKDQVMALKWVNDNIRQFGGNPKNITIFGESAGSVSAHYLTMSTMAKGLFGKAIFQSGSSASEWAIQSDPVAAATKLAELVGFKNTNKKNVDDLLRFLTNVQFEALIKAANAPDFSGGTEISFSPVLEKPFPPKKAIITESARNLQRLGKYNKVPTISGVTSNEGVLFIMNLAGLDLETVTLDQLIPDFQKYIPKELKTRLNAANRYVAANKIKEFYFATTDNPLEKFCTLMSDFAFIRDTEYSVKMFSKVVPSTYYYRFSHAGSLNTMKHILKVPYSGAAHGDDLRYFFKASSEELKLQVPTAQDTAVIHAVTEMWTNFARTGNPTPALSDNIKTLWMPVTENEFNCYDISDDSSLIQNPFLERSKFWDELNNIQ